MKRITTFLFSLLILLLPSQLGYHFWPTFSFVQGIRVDYLSPTIYFTDIVIFALLIIERKSIRIPVKYVLLFFFLAAINTLFSLSVLITTYRWLKIAELILLSVLVYEMRPEVNRVLVKYLPFTLLWTSLLSLLQFINRSSLNGFWYWLGERSFTTNTPDIALSKISTFVSLRPYATFPHPNALAGFLIVSVILLFPYRRLIPFFWLLSALVTVVFILCESYSALLSGVVVITFLVLKSVTHVSHQLLSKIFIIQVFVFSLIFPILFISWRSVLPLNLYERLELATFALNSTSNHPLFGVGLGNFIPALSGMVRRGTMLLLQPVHNVVLLFFAETGLVGIVSLFVTISTFPLTLPLVSLLTISLFDHYWVTLQAPSLFLAIVIGLSYNQRPGEN